MIKEVVRIYQLTYIEAETDDGAVEFYKRIGFQVKSLGENIQDRKISLLHGKIA